MKQKIINDCKAIANVMIPVIIVLVLIIAGAYIMLNPSVTGSTEYWETKNEFGTWQDEIEIGFKDGTTESLKIIDETPTMSVYYKDKEITYVTYKITASTSGEGYDGAEIKTENYKITCVLSKTSGGPATVWSNTYSVVDQTHQVPMFSSKQITAVKINVEDKLQGWADADYNIGFAQTSGGIKYRGYPDGGDFTSATLPPNRGVDIEVKTGGGGGGQIIVTLISSTPTS